MLLRPGLLLACLLLLVVAGPRCSREEQVAARPAPGQACDQAGPRAREQRALRWEALALQLAGKLPQDARVVQLPRGQHVELKLERTARVFVLLLETEAQRHNEIPEPDRSVNNTSIWQPDFNRAYYEDLVFRRMREYFEQQSSGRYSLSGDVTEWITLPGGFPGFPVASRIPEAMDAWAQSRLDAGWSPAELRAYVESFDVFDKYDHDGDGDFDEPDGVLDHLIAVEPVQGGFFGPVPGEEEIGTTGILLGEVSSLSSNQHIGAFLHEFGHDLGLPEEYSINFLSFSDNASGFWSVMGLGQNLFGESGVGLDGTASMNAWDKLQVGWLDYETARAGKRSSHRLGPASTTTKAAQAVVVSLPPYRVPDLHPTLPHSGVGAWWSGEGEGLDVRMTRVVEVPAGSPVLSLALWWDILQDVDYAYVSVSRDGGATWTNLAAPGITTNDDPFGFGLNEGNGITGRSAPAHMSVAFEPVAFDLTDYAGETVLLGIRYKTADVSCEDDPDCDLSGLGLVVDDVSLGAFFDGAEGDADGWSLEGFQVLDAESTHFYIAEYRDYRGTDAALRYGPWIGGFGGLGSRFAYQRGVLISYWNPYYSEERFRRAVNSFPGAGLILPIDAHPEPILDSTGAPYTPVLQVYDAPFGLEPTEPIGFYEPDGPFVVLPSLPAQPVFDDSRDYWFESAAFAGVKVPRTGTVIRVVAMSSHDGFVTIQVRPKAMRGPPVAQ